MKLGTESCGPNDIGHVPVVLQNKSYWARSPAEQMLLHMPRIWNDLIGTGTGTVQYWKLDPTIQDATLRLGQWHNRACSDTSLYRTVQYSNGTVLNLNFEILGSK